MKILLALSIAVKFLMLTLVGGTGVFLWNSKRTTKVLKREVNELQVKDEMEEKKDKRDKLVKEASAHDIVDHFKKQK